MKTLKEIFNWIVYAITGGGDLAGEMVDAGILDYSGQGRNAHGK